MKKISIYSAAILASLFWGASFIWYKQAYIHFDALTVIFLRLILAAFLLIVINIFFKQKESIKREDIPIFLLLSFFEPFCYFLGESLGMRLVSATLGSLIIAMIPLFTPIFAYFMIKEKITIYSFLGLIISFAGVSLILLNKVYITSSFVGIIFLLIAVISANLYGITLKKLLDSYSGITIVKLQSIIGVIYFLPLYFIFSSPTNLSYQLINYLPILKLSIFGSVLAFLFITFVIRNIGVINANIFTNMIPVYTAILAYFYLQEPIGIRNIFGIFFVIFGLVFSQIPQLRRGKAFKNEIFRRNI